MAVHRRPLTHVISIAFPNRSNLFHYGNLLLSNNQSGLGPASGVDPWIPANARRQRQRAFFLDPNLDPNSKVRAGTAQTEAINGGLGCAGTNASRLL
jgi:hypothetical protein